MSSSSSFMASLLTPTPSITLKHHKNHVRLFSTNPSCRIHQRNSRSRDGVCVVSKARVGEDVLERQSVSSAEDNKGLEVNEARPDDKLPYRGAWLWVGSGMIHLMELPNPDPMTGRPEHGGRDRHTCVEIRDVAKLKAILDEAGIPYTLSKSGRPAIFFRDPDQNALEFAQF